MAGRIDGAAMLRQTCGWAEINSGTGNLPGLATVAGQLADAFAALPGIRMGEISAALHNPANSVRTLWVRPR